MSPITRRPQLLITTFCSLISVAAVAIVGCNNNPTPASPASTSGLAPVTTAPATAPAGTRIVGKVATNPWNALNGGGVVYIADASAKRPGAPTSATINIREKEFTPFIAVITAGSTIEFGNVDPLTHHIFSPDGEKWDTGNLPQQGTVGRTFDSPGAYTLLCNFHPEMLGYLLVIPSSYFGMVGTDGKYALTGVPPGTYQLTAWVPRLESTTQSVTVTASGDATANFELRAPSSK